MRSEVRKQKLWALSDLIRDRLKALGVTIEDSKEGTSWRWSIGNQMNQIVTVLGDVQLSHVAYHMTTDDPSFLR